MLAGAPAWGRLGDRHGRRRVLAAAFLAGAPVALALGTLVLPVVIAGYLAWSLVASAFVPLTDSLALTRLGGSRSRFARVRIAASTAYIVVVVLVGAAISFTAARWSAPGIVGAGLCLIGAAAVAARLRGELVTGAGVAVDAGAGLIEGLRGGVGRHRTYLAGLSLAFAGVNAPGLFTGPRVAEVGGSGWEVGLAIAAGTLVELPAFLVLPWLLRVADGRRLFLAGGILLGVAGVLSALAPTPALLIAARLLFGAGFAWLVIPSLGAITAAAEPAEHAGAAALHFATSAVGSLLVAVAGLPLVALTGSVSGPLAAAALVTPIGAVIALRAWPTPRAARIR
jgi:MFS family permease